MRLIFTTSTRLFIIAELLAATLLSLTCIVVDVSEQIEEMAHKRDHILVLILMTISTFTFMIPTCHGGSHHPFAAKASLLRLWRRVLPNARLPPFLLEKASPLNATSVAVFGGYIANHTLSDHIASFCTAADLLCTRRIAVGGAVNAVTEDVDFQSYNGKDFKRYKVGGVSGIDSFKNYSVKGDFKGYGRDGNLQSEVFANYGPQTNVEDEGFITYGSGGSAGTNDFSSYGLNTNVQDRHFKNYGTDSNITRPTHEHYLKFWVLSVVYFSKIINGIYFGS